MTLLTFWERREGFPDETLSGLAVPSLLPHRRRKGIPQKPNCSDKLRSASLVYI